MEKKTVSAISYYELPEQARRELDEFARIIIDLYHAQKKNKELKWKIMLEYPKQKARKRTIKK